jgi:hypothetical protein
MAQIGNKLFNNIAGAGETPIYQRTGGGTGGGGGGSVSKYSSGWLAGWHWPGGDPNIRDGGFYDIHHNLGTRDIHVACYVNQSAPSDNGDVFSIAQDIRMGFSRGFVTRAFTDNTVTINFGADGFGIWQAEVSFNGSYVKFVVTG